MSLEFPNPEQFLKLYNINAEAFDATGLKWNQLKEIYNHHKFNTPNLLPSANYIADSLRQIKEVHSIRIRIKDPEHLIEKIIRKKIENPDFDVSIENYREKITDLIGVRALHLFKDDWNKIHEKIVNLWDLNETPTANVRKGDPDEYSKLFQDKGCEINEHKFGYRSVHYLIKSNPSKEVVIAELQVRTIFEEGWSEIDHNVRYPYDLDNTLLTQLSAIHNRLAGSADEIGSFIKILKKEIQEKEAEFKSVREAQEKLIKELSGEIESLKITKNQKKELEEKISYLHSTNLFDFSATTKILTGVFNALKPEDFSFQPTPLFDIEAGSFFPIIELGDSQLTVEKEKSEPLDNAEKETGDLIKETSENNLVKKSAPRKIRRRKVPKKDK